MDLSQALKDRIVNAVRSAPFYEDAERWSDPSLPAQKQQETFKGWCGIWSESAKSCLTANGLEVLSMCTAESATSGPTHFFLMVRDPATGAVVYYDPSAEQFGITGAHRQAFTREEIISHNAATAMKWLDQPILYKPEQPDWEALAADPEHTRKLWGGGNLFSSSACT